MPKPIDPLIRFRKEYNHLLPHIKKRCPSWEMIESRLLAHDSKKLKLATLMQGGGQLFGIDQQGKALFKDRGTEPVMYGCDENYEPVIVYDRDPEGMKRIIGFLGYEEMHEAVLKAGYEMFPVSDKPDFSDEMQQVIDQTGEPFIASENRQEWRISYLETEVYYRAPLCIDFDPYNGPGVVRLEHPVMIYDDPGVMRLLRV